MKKNETRKTSLYVLIVLCACMVAAPWKILSQPDVKKPDAVSTDKPGMPGGELQALGKDGAPAGKCPLKHTDVKADISGFIARVTVTQEFQNPYTEKIEAVYVFPLSDNSAVDSMTMLVGDRKIRGVIKRREEARRVYEEAKSTGHVASLLEQERTNIFTQSVANIMPGDKVIITISYVEFLDYKDGQYQFVFPMVVGPRYIPGSPTGQQGTGWSPDTTQAPDASRITPPVTPEGTRAGHDISLSVRINAGFPLRDISSRLHDIDVTHEGESVAVVSLKDKETIPNKDFILDYKTAGDKIEDAVLTHKAEGKDGFFTLIIQPPERAPVKEIVPKEMIFVIDTSGSQQGWPVEKAKETMKHAITNMNPDDTFQLLSFSNDVDKLFKKPEPNNAANREKAMRYLGTRLGSGGTEMIKAIHAALDPAPDPKRVRIVVFMTDGYVGNDMEIIAQVQKSIGKARFFSFGVGDSVNRFLLDELGHEGRGEVEYVTLEDSGEAAAKRFYGRIANPVLTDITVDYGNLPIHDVYPELIPDLFSVKPVVIKGRYSGGGGAGIIRIKGRTAAGPYEKDIPVTLPAVMSENDVLGTLWARTRIAELMRKDYSGMQSGNPDERNMGEIINLGLEFSLMTQYTSFVAVEEKTITDGGMPKTIAVPVEMPEGVSYQGVFGEDAKDEDKPSAMMYRGGSGSGNIAMPSAAYSTTSPAQSGAVRSKGYYRASDEKEDDGSLATDMAPVDQQMLTTDIPKLHDEYLSEKYPAEGVAAANESFGDYLDKKSKTPGELDKPLEQYVSAGEALLASRLHSSLIGLAEKVKTKGSSGKLKLDGFEVKDWKVTVTLFIGDASKENLEAIKKLGFETLVDSNGGKTIVGKIDVRALDDLAMLKFVTYVSPLTE